jgi:hypothetical protein
MRSNGLRSQWSMHLRHQGFASALVSAAMAFARAELGLPFGLLHCHPELVGFYLSRGWSEIPEPTFLSSARRKPSQVPGKAHGDVPR